MAPLERVVSDVLRHPHRTRPAADPGPGRYLASASAAAAGAVDGGMLRLQRNMFFGSWTALSAASLTRVADS